MDETWIDGAISAVMAKLDAVAARTDSVFPYTTVGGKFDDWEKINPSWWTNGFWGGILWQIYHINPKQEYADLAIRTEEKLDGSLMDPYGMDHDSGFKWVPTAVAHYKIDGNEASFRRALLAAENLAGRFNPAGNYIRAWNDANDGTQAGTAIIDCMINLPLLYWAYENTKDPRFYHIAVRHADTTEKYFIREDGSAIHIVQFDAQTGEFIDSVGGQGYEKGSSWTRGQAWAIYGFALSFKHTKNEKYLDASRRVADYFISQMQNNGAVPVDFCQPRDVRREDSSAAAIAASGFLTLSDILKNIGNDFEEASKKYRDASISLLEFLYENRCNFDENCDYILENCADSYHSERGQMSLIYGDYFFLEALLKSEGKELRIW
ncbi:MAG: glycoside hydrolase family 88 protein [Clostridiales bacterium]|nr:glycoside hydrolase family 88 protein [Clostridiales bacterium]